MTAATNPRGRNWTLPANLRPTEFAWIWLALALLVLATSVFAPSALHPTSLQSILPFAAVLTLLAVGQTLVVQQRGLDMSVAAVVTLSGLLVAKIGGATGSAPISILATCLACGAIGALNGYLVSRLGISPIVATLATGAAWMGAARLMSDGSAVQVLPSLQDFARGRLLGWPALACIAALVVVSAHVVLRHTPIGRRYVAVGSNENTARTQGTHVGRYQIGTYAAAGLCYAVAGVALAGFVGYATPTAGTQYLLPSIAVVVVGGTPFTGGRGSVIATGAAALFMTLLSQLALSLGADPAVQLLVQATAIVVAVSIRRLPDLARCRRDTP